MRFPSPVSAAMRALSTRNDEPQAASRPYDKGRDNEVLGEGSRASWHWERRSYAIARGATIYAEVGAGVTSDAFHVAAPDPEGLGASRAIFDRVGECRGEQKRRRPHQCPRHEHICWRCG